MTKALWKVIITRSRLKIVYLKSRNEENCINYKKQRNFCTKLLRKTKQKYFCNLNMKDLNDYKRFWKKKFSHTKVHRLIMSYLKTKLVVDSSIIANTFNSYFINIKITLDLKTFYAQISIIVRFIKTIRRSF